MPETDEEYTKRLQRRAARKMQKELGIKYTKALREVQANWGEVSSGTSS